MEADFEVEELEQVIAPALTSNDNEAPLSDQMEADLEVAGREQLIAPALAFNHNDASLEE
ncbi:MAG TPA: hypothetical protein VI756_09830 [Blastocatellia bacterium]